MSPRRRTGAYAAATALGLGLLTWIPGPVAADESPRPAARSTAPPAARSTEPRVDSDGADAPVAAGLIVRYAPGTPAREAPGVPTGAGSVTVTDLEMGRKVDGVLRTVEFAEVESAAVAELAAEQLASDPDVLFAEPDWVVTLDDVSRDAVSTSVSPRTNQSSPPWGLDRIDQRSGTNGLYDYGTTGAGVDVYVIDSGIRATHVDFGGRVAAGANFYPGLTDTSDCNGHGTHVAGTIGGATYGVAKDVTLIPVRVFTCSGGTWTSVIVSALAWVRDQHTGARPAVANLSLGGGVSTSLDDAVAQTVADGVTVVVASGNDTADACNSSPAREPTAITVNASTSADTPAYFTNSGTCTDLYAPGSGILSAWYTSNTAAATVSGTSMASPHVAGAAARVLQRFPSFTPTQVWNAIDSATTPMNFNASAGDANKLLYVDPLDSAVQQPTSVTITPAIESLAVSWTAPATPPAPTAYDVQYSDDSLVWTADDSVASTSTTIDGVTGGTPYWVRVRSATADDSSAWVVAGPVSPLPPTAPGAVTALEVAVDDSALDITWSPPVSTGGRPVLYYDIQHTSDDSTWVVDDTTTSTTTTISNLTNGTPYRVRVRAVNAIGAGGWQTGASTFAPRTLIAPTVPQSLSATAGNASLAVTWSAPADNGGRPVTSYAVEHRTDGSAWINAGPVGTPSITLTGLANGTAHAVRVAAITVVGQGAWAEISATPTAPPSGGGGGGGGAGGGGGGGAGGGGGGGAAPSPPSVTEPGPPVITSTAPGDSSITVTWAASDDTGGELPSEFVVELEGDGRSVTRSSSLSTITFAELTNGERYRARVAALNSAGTGDWSAWTEDLTPFGLAGAPRALRAEAGDASAALSWASPESDGGSPVTGYRIEVSASGTLQSLDVTDTSTVLVGLANDRTYSVRVAAVTAAGLSAWSDPVVITPRASRVSAPRAVQATRKSQKVIVTWSVPAQGSALRYVVTASLDGKPFRTAGTSKAPRATFTVSATVRTVRIQVRAIDSVGPGPQSAVVPVMSKR